MFRLLLLAFIATCAAGCGTTISPVKRRPLEIISFHSAAETHSQKVFIQFQDTLSGTPIALTVWDNAAGAFASEKESHQIGYTQNYKELLPVAMGGAVGGAIVLTSQTAQRGYTRIVIPFGRIFEETVAADLKQAFPNAVIEDTQHSSSKPDSTNDANAMVTLKVSEFQVWEDPLNHLNFRAVIEYDSYQNGQTNHYFVRREITKQSIGSILSTSRGAIQKMNAMADNFAEALSQEILANVKTGFY